jgi:hypothetical protein
VAGAAYLRGSTAFDGSDSGEVPTAFVADTVNK